MNSEWTIDTIKEHFEKMFAEKDKALNAALAASKEAVTVAETNAEKWRANANEWRAAMNDREKKFALKDEVDIFRNHVEREIDELKTSVDKRTGGALKSKEMVLLMIAIASVMVAIMSFIYK